MNIIKTIELHTSQERGDGSLLNVQSGEAPSPVPQTPGRGRGWNLPSEMTRLNVPATEQRTVHPDEPNEKETQGECTEIKIEKPRTEC